MYQRPAPFCDTTIYVPWSLFSSLMQSDLYASPTAIRQRMMKPNRAWRLHILQPIEPLQKPHHRIWRLGQSKLFWRREGHYQLHISLTQPRGKDGGYSRPIHFLGPPAKGTKSHPPPTLSPSHLSGLKSAASTPQISVRYCMPYVEINTRLPFGRKIGLIPLGPPPLGSVVSCVATLSNTGIIAATRKVSLMQSCR